jgi:cyclophilin family peptidyl-prolyl cis-trans isomerase
MFTFAAGGAPNTRSTQVFINLADNSRLDQMGFAPVGKVVFGMDVVQSLYTGYGEPPDATQELISTIGNSYLDQQFPKLDSIKRAIFIQEVREYKPMTPAQVAEANVSKGVSERAPDTFKVKFDCTMGTFVMECYRDWSPNGADRFYTLVKNGFYNESRFFRVVPNFIVQFGLPAVPDTKGTWVTSTFPDDPPKVSNTEGTVVFAKPAKPANARATQLFINLGDNAASLDQQGFTPFGTVIEGMDVVKKINSTYGEQPEQSSLRERGNEYLDRGFPGLDGIKSATLIDAAQPAVAPPAEPAPAAAPAETPAPAATESAAPQEQAAAQTPAPAAAP